ncbi:MAG TPA: toll/interleukin-1 receptor domain-containing protein [Thermoanaerobaculia bacterium]|nr:toll/interleukin-1 receptor domain-containing protein [Thermoanaerobaculia bacterium]
MAFKNACFISYSHGRDTAFTRTFITELKRAIEEELDQLMAEEVVVDFDRLEPAALYNEALAKAICESVVMIVVYSPRYEQSAYCRREYEAMRRLEERRLAMLGEEGRTLGLILPIILANDVDELPEQIKGRHQVSDMSKFSLRTPKIGRHKDFQPQIREICRAILERYRAFQRLEVAEEACRACPGFELPREAECPPWRERTVPRRAPFPGRELPS